MAHHLRKGSSMNSYELKDLDAQLDRPYDLILTVFLPSGAESYAVDQAGREDSGDLHGYVASADDPDELTLVVCVPESIPFVLSRRDRFTALTAADRYERVMEREQLGAQVAKRISDIRKNAGLDHGKEDWR